MINDQQQIIEVYQAIIIMEKQERSMSLSESMDISELEYYPQVEVYIQRQIAEAELNILKVHNSRLWLVKKIAIPTKQNDIRLLVVLSRGHPVNPPQVFLEGLSMSPSVCNYRNLLDLILQETWSPFYTLKDIVQKAPDFIISLLKNDSELQIQRMGNYYLKHQYDFTFFKELDDCSTFLSFEQAEQKIFLYVVVLTSCHFLLFKPSIQPKLKYEKLVIPKENELNKLFLVFIAQIQALSEVKCDRTHQNGFTLVFSTLEIRKMVEYSKTVWKKSLKITKGQHFIECVLKSIKKFSQVKSIDLQISNIAKNSTEDLLRAEVRAKQQKLEHYFNRDTIEELRLSYQNLIQFYSEEGQPYAEIYTFKLNLLFNRFDVQLVMQQSPKK